MIPKEDGMGLSKGASQMVEPSAPPMYEEHETPPPTYDQVFSAEDKGDPTPMPGAEDCKCEITTNKKKEAAKHLGPWKSADIGEPVDDSKDPILTKRKRRRKVKKALGWAAWIGCAPVLAALNCMRESPQDTDDPYDANDDPLRPWSYNVNLNTRPKISDLQNSCQHADVS